MIVGLVAGAIAGILLLVIWMALPLFRLTVPNWTSWFYNNPQDDGVVTSGSVQFFIFMTPVQFAVFMFSFIMPGGLYGLCQSFVCWLTLQEQTPRLRRSLQAHFVATLVGTIVLGVLLFGLIVIGLAGFLRNLGLLDWQILVLCVLIAGGVGGIAQAIVQRFLLNTTTQGGYWQWIVPLGLLGHVSGGIVGLIAVLLIP